METESSKVKFADDILQSITEDDIKLLLQDLKIEFPSSLWVYNWISVQTRWRKKGLDVDIVCPRGDWTSGIVLGLGRNLELYGKTYAIIYAKQGKEEELSEVLRKSNIIPWQKISRIRGVLQSFSKELKNLINEKTNRIPHVIQLHMYYQLAEHAAEVKIPVVEGVDVRHLEEQHTDEVCATWSFFADSYRPVVRAMIQYNHTVGVFLGEKLVSMVLETEYGAVGLLETLPEYQNRGYGTLAAATITRNMGRDGINPQLGILETNYKSKQIFERVGYKFAFKSYTYIVDRV